MKLETKPKIILLADESKESETWREKFVKLDIDLQVLPGSEGLLPCIKIGNILYWGRHDLNMAYEMLRCLYGEKKLELLQSHLSLLAFVENRGPCTVDYIAKSNCTNIQTVNKWLSDLKKMGYDLRAHGYITEKEE